MNDTNSLGCDIAAVGLGITGVHQITREVEETIRRCTKTFAIDSGHGVVDYLRILCPNVIDLLPRYKLGEERLPAYRDMASEVVAAALETPPVCFATYGHPWMYCYPTTLLHRAARVLKLKFKVFPGISSLDTLLVDLGIDTAFSGLQMYEATDLVVRRRPLQTDVQCVILQADVTAQAVYPQHPPVLEDLLLLQDYLLEFYPPDHSVRLVVSKTHPLLSPMWRCCRWANLLWHSRGAGLWEQFIFLRPISAQSPTWNSPIG